ncbi:MAG: shikimate kinase [Clostridia bacterium]|nr:shikimate kinase [Clostridia bacterium]MBP3360236.1 shikimate kinase [Clostridia bacterium]
MNIVLTGYMGSGKTAVGTYLAEKQGLTFLDSDSMIEQQCGMSISEIFAASGEEYFRSVEAEVIERISEYDGAVISTGGGVVLNTQNIAELRKNGVIVNLEPEEDVILTRLGADDGTRPLIKDSSMTEILERFNARKPYYDNCDIKIKVTKDKGIAEVAEEILRSLEEKYEGEFRSSGK